MGENEYGKSRHLYIFEGLNGASEVQFFTEPHFYTVS